jgi:hypothetical protein
MQFLLSQLINPSYLMQRRALALYLALVLGVAVYLGITDPSGKTGINRGDFPAFWSMAAIASSAEPFRLYDTEVQRQVQNLTWPALQGSLLPAAYPAHLAFFLRPLTLLSPLVARWVWTVICVAAAFFGIRLLVRLNRSIDWAPWMVFSAMCGFTPVLRGILGGQVLSFGILIFAMVLTLERRRGSLLNELLLGALLGIWLFKPYYALCAIAVPVLQRRWGALLSFVLLALISWCFGALVAGASWLGEWTDFAGRFARINLETNAHQMPNLWAQGERLFGDAGDLARLKLAWLFSAYAALLLAVYALLGRDVVRVFLKAPKQHGTELFLVMMALVVVAVPQVNFYDLGLSAGASVVLIRPEVRGDRWFIAGCIGLSQFSINPPLGFPVHFALGLMGLVYVCVRVRDVVKAEFA